MKTILEEIKRVKNELQNSLERRIIAIHSSSNEDLIEVLKRAFNKEKFLFVHDNDEKGLEILKYMNKKKVKSLTYEKTTKVLGLTFENLVLDLRHNLNPDDIGRLLGIVKGGGLIIFILPDREEINLWKTRFHEILASYPYTIREVKNNFERYFYKKIIEDEFTLVVDLKSKKIIKYPKKRKKKIHRRKIFFPKKSEIPKRIYKTCITQDQIEVLYDLESFWKENKKSAFILKANRGRGKSASIGLFLSFLAWKFRKIGKQLLIGITAPEPSNVEILFKFLKIGLRKIGIRFKEIENGIEIANGRIMIVYKRPVRIKEKYWDLVVVDEAAGIPIPFLYGIIKKFRKTIFSSTIHGYEGAGRGFSVRFLKGIKEEKLAKIFEFEMKEPIRYSEDDPVENWLFNVLFLNAEPVKIGKKEKEDIHSKRLVYEKINVDKWFFENEKEVRDFIGIYILAHYRNRPKDIALLVNSPNHFPRCIKTMSGKIVNSIHLSKEGALDEKIIRAVFQREKPKGHVVPLVICRHYRNLEFGFLRGWRIVRIATHPEVMDLGIGSFALKELEKEAIENKLDYIGVSFGATSKLLRFWTRNGFIPLHISLERNTISGEYSVILVKPLSEKAKKLTEMLNYEFRLRILGSLMDVHFDIDHEIALFLLRTPFKQTPHYNLFFTENQKERMDAFLEGVLPYESVAEVCRELAKYYFLDTKNRPYLSETQEKIIVLKSFLVKSWKRTGILLEMESKIVINRFREAMKKLWKHYMKKD